MDQIYFVLYVNMERKNLLFLHKNYIVVKLKKEIINFHLIFQHNIQCHLVFFIKVKMV